MTNKIGFADDITFFGTNHKYRKVFNYTAFEQDNLKHKCSEILENADFQKMKADYQDREKNLKEKQWRHWATDLKDGPGT